MNSSEVLLSPLPRNLCHLLSDNRGERHRDERAEGSQRHGDPQAGAPGGLCLVVSSIHPSLGTGHRARRQSAARGGRGSLAAGEWQRDLTKEGTANWERTHGSPGNCGRQERLLSTGKSLLANPKTSHPPPQRLSASKVWLIQLRRESDWRGGCGWDNCQCVVFCWVFVCLFLKGEKK